MAVVRLSFKVVGMVQGVGFRYFVNDLAAKLGISGWVANCSDGSVAGEAEGTPVAMEEFLGALKSGPSGSAVKKVSTSPLPPSAKIPEGFEIKMRQC
jgi:acylphosphatase